jgi:hypothetical protein
MRVVFLCALVGARAAEELGVPVVVAVGGVGGFGEGAEGGAGRLPGAPTLMDVAETWLFVVCV